MDSAKGYILPAVAALVLLGYWLVAPGAHDGENQPSANGTAAPTAPSARGPAQTGADKTLEELQAAVSESAGELPAEYVSRQSTIVRGRIVACQTPDPPAYRVTIIGAPGRGGRIEAIEATPALPDGVDECVRRALRGLKLSAPPNPGRSVVEF